MTSERVIEARAEREVGRRAEATAGTPDKTTPQQKLVRAAESGRFEAIVAAAQPAEPPKMVTPEEREAELRAEGKWPEEKPRRPPKPKAEPKPPERELTPNEQYIDEHCRWRKRGPADYRKPIPYGRCLTEYDVLTGEIIGDGYDHSFEEDK